MLFILDKKGKTVGILSNDVPKACPYFNDVFTEALENNLSTLEFDTVSNHPSSSLLEVEGFVIYTDMDNKRHLFVIKEISDKHSDNMIKSVYCENSAVGDLLGCIVRPTKMNSVSLETAVRNVLNTTGWELGKIEYAGIQDIEFKDHITALEALHQIMKIYGVEMEYEVIFNGTKVEKKLVNVVIKRGTVTGKLFDYSKDIVEIERVEDTKTLVTALIGVGKADDQGNPMTFRGLSTGDSRYVVHEDYIADLEAFQRFNKDGKHIFGVFKDDKATNEVELLRNTLAQIKELSKPRLTYTAKVVLLEKLTGYSHEKVRLGDTIKVRDFTFSPALVLEARVIELKRSHTDPNKDEVTLGDYRPITIMQDSAIQKLQQIIFEKERQWDEAKRLAEEANENVVYKVEVHSTKGLIFRNGNVSTTLVAVVYKGKDEITPTLSNYAFQWKKFDKNGNLDLAWTNEHIGVGNRITVTPEDVQAKATFQCDVDPTILK